VSAGAIDATGERVVIDPSGEPGLKTAKLNGRSSVGDKLSQVDRSFRRLYDE
jgi:hypothetical protein